MFKPDEKPSTASMTALRERVKIARDKAQAAGLADVSVTLLECQGLLTFLNNVSSWAVFRGVVQHCQTSNYKGREQVVARLRHMVFMDGKPRSRRFDVVFKSDITEIAKTIEIGDLVVCDGAMTRGERGTMLVAHHLEILSKGHKSDGNEGP